MTNIKSDDWENYWEKNSAELAKELEEKYDEVDALKAENERLRAALETVEWIEDTDGVLYCQWCNQSKYMGHAPNCQHQAALGLTP